MRVDIDALSVEIAGATLVREVTMRAAGGTIVGLVGPNGSGKSSLLRCVYRASKPTAGTVRLDGADLHGTSSKEGARLLAALPQESVSEFDFTVEEVVAMGRMPHQRAVARASVEDERICQAALERVGARHLRSRGFLTLSGGEKQRVLIARALAQEPRVLVLDEPTNHLDIAQQLEVLHLVRGWGAQGERGRNPTVLAALHDLNLAATYCDELYVIADGSIVTSGPPAEVLTAQLLADVFGVRAHRVAHPESGAIQLLFDRLHTAHPDPHTSPVDAAPADADVRTGRPSAEAVAGDGHRSADTSAP